jgi:DNA repair exonuclease SbcCD ATPase subunit
VKCKDRVFKSVFSMSRKAERDYLLAYTKLTDLIYEAENAGKEISQHMADIHSYEKQIKQAEQAYSKARRKYSALEEEGRMLIIRNIPHNLFNTDTSEVKVNAEENKKHKKDTTLHEIRKSDEELLKKRPMFEDVKQEYEVAYNRLLEITYQAEKAQRETAKRIAYICAYEDKIKLAEKAYAEERKKYSKVARQVRMLRLNRIKYK